jgi:hypothetical protein
VQYGIAEFLDKVRIRMVALALADALGCAKVKQRPTP